MRLTIHLECMSDLDWRQGKDERNTSLCGNLFVVSEKNTFHKTPIRGNFVKSREGKFLFFVDEDNGKHVLTRERSLLRGRMAEDDFIVEQEMKDASVLHCTLNRKSIFHIRNFVVT